MPILILYSAAFITSFVVGYGISRYRRNIEMLDALYKTHDMWHHATAVDPNRWPSKETDNV